MARNRWVTVCIEGWVYLAVLVVLFLGALLRDINLMLVLFGMLAGPFLYNWRYVAQSLRRIRVERTLPARVGAGEPFELNYEAHSEHRWRSCWSLAVADAIERESSNGIEGGKRIAIFYDVVPRGTTRMKSQRMQIERRGRYRCGPIRLSTRYPFGLLRCIQEQSSQESLVVWPRLGRLTARWQQFRASSLQATRQIERRQGLLEGDYHGLRDYRAGDSPRWVHWRTTARRGELMVRQFERHKSQDVAVVVDLWRSEGGGEVERAALERTICFAATTVVDLCRPGGSRLWFATTGSHPDHLDGIASPGLMHELLDRLAVVEASATDALSKVLCETIDRLPNSTPVWLLSTRPVDLSDTERFGEFWSDARRIARLETIRCLDLLGNEWKEYFREV